MVKVRYDEATGRINLITDGTKEIPVKGCKYMTLAKRPQFNDQLEDLYVKDGRLIAVDDTHQPPLHRIVE